MTYDNAIGPMGKTSVSALFDSQADAQRAVDRLAAAGIPESHISRLTERFYRVSSSRTRETGGTGLGLAIVKHVLQLHQARLDITSEVGRGSTFTCSFGADRIVPRGKDPHEHPQDQHASRQHA